MVDIVVRPPELRQTAEQLRISALKIDRALQRIDQAMNALRITHFLGNRADTLQSHYAGKRAALNNAKNLVLGFSSDLLTAAAMFEKADNAGTTGSQYATSSASHVINVPPRTYALLSQLAYSDSPELPDELRQQGWEVLTTAQELKKTGDGYSGVAFINSRTGEVVIAHRGTDRWNINPFDGIPSDIDDDVDLRMGLIPGQYYESREFVEQVKDKLKYDARFSDYTLVHTGHSLGAALSDMNALTDGSKSIAFDNPGILQIVKDHRDVFSGEGRENLISYQSNPNVVHLGGENAGYVVQIVPKEGGAMNPLLYATTPTAIYGKYKETEIHHSLDNIINSLSPETGFPEANFRPEVGEGNHGFHNLGELDKGRIEGVANACYTPPDLPEL